MLSEFAARVCRCTFLNPCSHIPQRGSMAEAPDPVKVIQYQTIPCHAAHLLYKPRQLNGTDKLFEIAADVLVQAEHKLPVRSYQLHCML